MGHRTDLLEILGYIEPASLDYQGWVNVGMALKHEGYPADDWDAWSRRDPGRYHPGECARKWGSFQGSAMPVTGGTIVQMAMEAGWRPEYGQELDWDSEISAEGVSIDKGWREGKEIHEPGEWDPIRELATYIETLFGTDENVGYVTKAWERDGKKLPSKGCFDRTARQLLQALGKCKNGDIADVVGDYDPEAGAWIRFNPLDGKGCKDENVTDYRYALVESDKIELEEQNAIIQELELPVACLVHSGNKSIHAVVRIEAGNIQEYKKRVDYLYKVCEKNGLKVDRNNKNPSRLSRMPGILRNGRKQFLIGTNIGKESWDDWFEWIEGINDDLPDPEGLDSVWDHMPDLSPCLIEGVLRQGHKMLISGPSKAGKSFLLIELCIAIAEGRKWLSWACTQGRVLYVNLELDTASCLHRFKDVYRALGVPAGNLKNIDVWNLRGKSLPMDRLAPKLIRRALKKNYIAVIIDPIYKIITGDENSADQMAKFCNQFDLVCTELKCAVIYCHHHSKGSQGAKKAMDRASGSGVFARDPDALLDLIGLETTDALLKQEENKAVCAACIRALDAHGYPWRDELSQDAPCSSSQMLNYCENRMSPAEWEAFKPVVGSAREKAQGMTAWRIEGTLREFPKFPAVNLWFDYPCHREDESGALSDIQPEVEPTVRDMAIQKRKKQAEDQRREKRNAFEIEFSNLELDGQDVSAQALADNLETTSKELLSWFGNGQRQKKDLKKEYEKYVGEDGKTYIRRREHD